MKTGLPLYKRMQGDPRRIAAEQIHNEMYQQYGITHGMPGSVSEDNVRGKLDAILSSTASRDEKLDLLDALHPYTVNNVEHGGVSDVLEEVDAAYWNVYYEVKK